MQNTLAQSVVFYQANKLLLIIFYIIKFLFPLDRFAQEAYCILFSITELLG